MQGGAGGSARETCIFFKENTLKTRVFCREGVKGVKGPTTGQVLPLQDEMCPNVSAQERRDGQHAAALAQAASCETQAPSALTEYRSPTPPSSAAFASPAPTSISLRLLSLPVRAPRQHRQYDSAKWLCIASGSRMGTGEAVTCPQLCLAAPGRVAPQGLSSALWQATSQH